MARKKTHEEYKQDLAEKYPEFECLGKYQGNKVKILHRHKICGYEWEIRPNNILTGQGCPICANKNRNKDNIKTTNQYIEDLKLTNPDFDCLEEYRGNKTKILHRHKTCGHIWSVKPNNVLSGQGCPKCYGMNRTTEEYQTMLNELNKDIDVIEEYEGSHTKILHRHRICGNEWFAEPIAVLRGTNCPLCFGTKKRTNASYDEKLANVRCDFKRIEDYIDCNTPILHEHKICGYVWKINPNRLLREHTCPKCSNTIRKTTESYSEQLRIEFPEYEIVNKYINNHTKVLHKHKNCGYSWMITPKDIIAGYGCPVCSSSKGEKAISKYLDDWKIKYEVQKSFKGLLGTGNGKLRYDFFLKKHNLLIEFQGIQHYEPVEYFGGEGRFKIQQENDNRKRNYATKNNINLLEISYLEFENIEEILKSRLLIQSA